MTCFFGPYGDQTKVQLNALQSHKMGQSANPCLGCDLLTLVNAARFFPESKSHVFYPGAPVWAIDWCPMFVDDHHRPWQSFQVFTL